MACTVTSSQLSAFKIPGAVKVVLGMCKKYVMFFFNRCREVKNRMKWAYEMKRVAEDLSSLSVVLDIRV